MKWPISRLLVCVLLVVAAASRSHADCPHCFEVVQVRAEFTDGKVRVGYFEDHTSVTPTFIDVDGATVIDLSRYTEVMNGRDKIALIDSIFQFDSITTATTSAHIDSVSLSELKRLVHLGPVGFGAAGSINVYDTSVIRMLRGNAFARFDFEAALAECIYLSYDSAVTHSELASLPVFVNEIYSLDARLSGQMQYMEQFLIGSGARHLVGELVSDICWIDYQVGIYDSLSGPSAVGKYYSMVAHNLRGRAEFLQAIQHFVASEDSTELKRQIKHVFNSAECPTPEFDLSRPREFNHDQFAILFRAFGECYRLSRILGEDYNDPLEKAGVILIENWYD